MKHTPGLIEQCSNRVYTGAWTREHQCSRKGVIERDGKFYCKQHDPVAIKKKREKKNFEWEKELEANRKKQKLIAAAPSLLEALKDFVAVCETAPPLDLIKMIGESCKKASEAIKEATDES